MEAAIHDRLHRRELTGRFGHLARALDQKVVVHPDRRAGVRAIAMRLVLRDFVGVVDLAVIDAAGMDVEMRA